MFQRDFFGMVVFQIIDGMVHQMLLTHGSLGKRRRKRIIGSVLQTAQQQPQHLQYQPFAHQLIFAPLLVELLRHPPGLLHEGIRITAKIQQCAFVRKMITGKSVQRKVRQTDMQLMGKCALFLPLRMFHSRIEQHDGAGSHVLPFPIHQVICFPFEQDADFQKVVAVRFGIVSGFVQRIESIENFGIECLYVCVGHRKSPFC